jgi:hypothetical protein
MDVDTLLVDLNVISQLKEQDKLGVLNLPGKKQLVIYSGRYWFQGMYRWYGGSNRDDVLDFLSNRVAFVQKQAELFSEPVTEKTKVLRGSLKKNILTAIDGLYHLQTTYSDDSYVVAMLVLICNKLSECSKQIKTTEYN